MAKRVIVKVKELYTERELEREVAVDPDNPDTMQDECEYLVEAYNKTKPHDVSPQELISYRVEDDEVKEQVENKKSK